MKRDQGQGLVKPKHLSLQEFAANCSDVSLGELLLAKLNRAANVDQDLQKEVQSLLQQVLKLVDYFEDWAQSQAEARYITYVRESAKLRRGEELQTLEVRELMEETGK